MATQQDFLPNQFLKKDLAEKIDNFLKTPEKMLKKKRRFINISKRKQSISKMVIISTSHKSGKNGLSILTLKIEISTLAIKQIGVAIIDADAYYTTCKIKVAQVFVISMRPEVSSRKRSQGRNQSKNHYISKIL